ncbi:MAG: RadC family protein [Sphingobacteriaceae bacterium]
MENYESKIGIKSWAEEDRPREKLISHGRRILTDAELIAILIGSGSRNESAVDLSKRILHHFKNDLHTLGKVSVMELSQFKGIGEAKSISIIAALELGRRRRETAVKESDKIKGSQSVHQLLKPHFADLNHEEFWVLLLNRANRVISHHLISKGGQAGTVADPKIIFQTALENHAASIILAHNHPSGNLKPSQADIDLTKRIRTAGEMLDIQVLDHLIVTDFGYFSFVDEGMM